jgi:hypothetical protein
MQGSEGGGRGSRAQVELAQDAAHVMADCSPAEEEACGDLGIAQSLGQELEHVVFACGEWIATRSAGWGSDAEGSEQGGRLACAVASADLFEAAVGRLRSTDRRGDVAGSQQHGEMIFSAGCFEGQLEPGEHVQRETEVVPG